MGALTAVTNSAKETQLLGARLGELARAGDVFLLIGELGVGKTNLAQGLARGLGVRDYAISPSFVVVREHQGRLPFYHVDLYRLQRLEEVEELGLGDYFYGQGVTAVEWADRALAAMPPEWLLIRMRHLSQNRRSLTFEPVGERYLAMLSRFRFATWAI
ncbi:MAG: tRNA (adenosine(37)-N6)-threonylcarbamoyltransferase complex ATPase subunit type 1 TsaE [Chloroflexi bacterium]|nr:tRNA (adenosine(37)-N6)-threonylcarbamoyltransferase complex ATPase subunit type 1 TsaE [Chloroflexota bacterium]